MAQNSILKLRVDTSEYDVKLKKAAEGIMHLAEYARRGDGAITGLEKSEVAFIRELGNMNTVSRTASGRVRELCNAYKDLKVVYDNMSAAEKGDSGGKALLSSLNELKARVQESRAQLQAATNDLNGTNGMFGQFSGVIDNVGRRLGVTGNLTEMLTSKTALLTGAIGAVGAAVTKSAEAWAQYNTELAKQDEITTVTTGLKGNDANRMTDTMRALSDTYGVDFRQAVNAANTLMAQFGKSGDEAIRIIKDGMQGMIRGDGPKMLSMIQQYAPAFQSAGVSAEKLVAVIQNSEGGIFTDQNMQAIVMGIKNVRLMTNSTAAALAKVGIDGKKMSKELEAGTLNVFDALKIVSKQLQTVDSNSQAAGEVMQTIFGRQGVMAGTNLGKAIAELNTNLDETKRQTGECGEAMARLQVANEKLNVAIRETFGYDGWDQMTTGIKSKLISALADCVTALGNVRDVAKDTYKWLDINLGVGNWIEVGAKVADQFAQNMNTAYLAARTLYGYLNQQAEKDATRQALEEESGVSVMDVARHAQGANNALPDVTLDPNKRSITKGGKKTYRPPTISTKYRDGVGFGATESMDALNSQQSFWSKRLGAATNLADATAAQLSLDDIAARKELQPMALSLGISTEQYDMLQSSLTEKIDSIADGIEPIPIKLGIDPDSGIDLDKAAADRSEKTIKNLTADVSNLQKTTNVAGNAMNTLGAAIAGLEDPGAKVAGIIMQSIGNVVLGFSQAISKPTDPWSWIAGAVAGTATMISTIAAIHSATGYAEGGIVEGNSFSGDNIYAGNAMVNAGELILNKSQQSAIAGQLQGVGETMVGNRQDYVTGQKIFLGVNNYLKSTGRGQLVTTQ